MKTPLPTPDSTTSFSMNSAKVRLTGLGGLLTVACFYLLAATVGSTSALAAEQPSVSQPVILADFNHDGIPDALVQSTMTPTATIAFGSVPYGTFGGNVKAVTFPAACTSLPAGSIAVGDFNGDGFPDIAYFCDTKAGTMLGKGDGTFGAPVTLPGVATSSGVLGDFNNDGKIDIAVLSNEDEGQAIRFLSGKGDGTFNEPLLSNLAVETYSTLVAADLNADGYPDLLLINSAPDVAASLEVLGNNKNGTFGVGNQGIYSANTVASLSFGGTAPILVGNFFGAATTDVAVVDTGVNGQLFALKNTSTATAYSFSDPVTIPVANLTGAQAGKFTGSGFADIAVSNGASIAVLANDGAANFAASYPTLTLVSTASRFAVADANNDSYADIYTASLPVSGTLQLGVSLTTGSATATSQPISLAIGTRAISAAWIGNVNFTGSTATGSQIVVGVPSTTTLTSSKNPSTVGDLVSFSVHVAPATSSSQTPTGSVVLKDGTAVLTSGALDDTGNFSYSTSSLTQTTHTITATYAGNTLYAGSFATVVQVVNHAAVVTPTVTWTPLAIVYGTPLSGSQLNAVATGVNGVIVPGVFTYTPAAGAILDAGAQTLSVTFTPADLLSFNVVSKTVSLVVSRATPTVTWATPASIVYGTQLTATQLNAAATGVNGTALSGVFTYAPPVGTVLNAGAQTLSVLFTPTNAIDYASVSRTVTLTVAKATPVINWATPASIAYGTPLSAAQLNATAVGVTGTALPGTFSYTPAAGTVPAAGTQTLSVSFAPEDATDYSTVTRSVNLVVTGPATTATTLTVTSAGEAAATVASGTVVTLTAAVTANGNSVAPGQVAFCDATVASCTELHLLGTAQLVAGDSTSTATYKFVPGIGAHSYRAVFLGTSAALGSASTGTALAVTGTYPTATTIAQSGMAGNYTLTATTVGTGSSLLAPTGSVSFLDTSNANASLGSSALGASTSGFALAQAAGSPVTVGGGAYGVATGDFNGDGFADAVVENYNAGTVSVLLGKGDGTFQSQVTYAVGVEPERVLVADLNGDGKLDLVVANTGSGTVSVLLGNGDGTFQAQATYPCSSPVGLGVMDLNHDGIPDVVAGDYYSNTISVLLGHGDGTLQPAVTYATGGTPQTVAEGDLNGDGNVDVVVGNESGATVGVFLGNGDGTFQAMVTYGVGNLPQGVQVGDFNADGKQDIAVTNQGDGTISVLLGNGDGTFQAQETYPVGVQPVGLAIADFNGDGIEDITVGNTGQASLTQGVLLGKGDGTFQPQVTFPTGNFPYGVAVADFNGDGLPDMAVSNFSDATATIFLSQPTATATATVTGVSPQTPGTHEVVASYPGDAHYVASTSLPTALVVADTTPTVASFTPTTTVFGTGATTITITGAGFAAVTVVQVNGTAIATTLVNPTTLTAVIPASYFTAAGTLTITLSNSGVTTVVPVGSFNVSKANPIVRWATPATIAYGTPLSAAQLNATATGITTAPLPGKLTYTPAAGTVPAPGTQTLSVSFAPDDATDYNTATSSVQLVVTGVTVASFTPTTATLGTGATTITVTGAGFAATTVVQVNGTAILTTLVNPTTLTAVIPASYFKAVGTLTITLANPGITTPIPVGSFNVTASQPVPILEVPPTTDPGTQPAVTLSLAAPFPVDITATVSLSFTASTTPAIDDPAIVFEESGTRTQNIPIPAGTTTVPPILLQAGTVAGTITVPITLTAGGVNVTPANLAPGIIVVPAAVPTVSSVTTSRSGKQLTVVVHGFSNTREMVNAKFHFTPAAGATLGTTDLTVLGQTIFNNRWFQTTASDQYGSTFTYTQVFDLSDDATTVSAVDVTLTNSVGASDMKSAQ